MKKLGIRKFQLHRETLRGLADSDQPDGLPGINLEAANGGRPAVTAVPMSCEGSC